MGQAEAPVIPANNTFYNLMRGLIFRLSRLYFRLEVIGSENLPRDGGVLLVANHASNLDPTTVACSLSRPAHFLAKQELFTGIMGKFLPRLNACPLNRSGIDRKALRHCREVLSQGHVLIVFPEGQRTLTGRLLEIKPGAALFAAQTGMPIVPAYIEGSREAMPVGAKRIRPHKIRVFLGQPFCLDPRDVLTMHKKDFYTKAGAIITDKILALEKLSHSGLRQTSTS